MELLTLNAQTLERDIQWFIEILNNRFKHYFGDEQGFEDIFLIQPPDLTNDPSLYAGTIKSYNFDFLERFVLILTLIPHIRPQLLDTFFEKNAKYDRGFTEFGGIKGTNHSGFIPTGETAAFILAGNDFNVRFRISKMFEADHAFARNSILKLEPVDDHEPILSGVLTLSNDYMELFTTGIASKPNFSSKFPAKLINTELDWNDLVLEDDVLKDINQILAWIKYKDELLITYGLKKKIKPGFRSLFYGPPGTGKTFTACLMGKTSGKDVYKIDLSMVVSKYVGETEKNLGRVFDMAETKDWILFFDEADALFGKRTSTQSSQERYSNQEVAYLLQRTEDYPGVVILASNLKGNIDEAFSRRFHSIIYFAMPKPKERRRIWENTFEGVFRHEKKVEFEKIAERFEIAGGGIVNVLKHCAIKAIERPDHLILEADILEGIKKELMKEGKTV
jgi:hypothetical protein